MATLERKKVGGLNCHIITAANPACLLVLCHGFGAPGDDLVQLGAYLIESQPKLRDRVTIVFPEAPLALAEFGAYGGRAWWPLDMEKLTQAVESGNFRDLRAESPEELPTSRAMLAEMVAEFQADLGLDMAKTVVGGFSQGSMLATDYTLHADEKPAGLIIWSGTLLNEAVWKSLAHHLEGFPIIQSHGTTDPVLPFEAAKWLGSLLHSGGGEVEFIEFRGGHTIPPEALDAAAHLILSLLAE